MSLKVWIGAIKKEQEKMIDRTIEHVLAHLAPIRCPLWGLKKVSMRGVAHLVNRRLHQF